MDIKSKHLALSSIFILCVITASQAQIINFKKEQEKATGASKILELQRLLDQIKELFESLKKDENSSHEPLSLNSEKKALTINSTESKTQMNDPKNSSFYTGEVIKQSEENGYTLTPGIGMHKIFIDGKNWMEANETCQNERGHLAVINSKAEEQLLLGMVANSILKLNAKPGVQFATRVWIGIHAFHEKNKWETVTGQLLNSTEYNGHWHSFDGRQQPDNWDGEHNCVSLLAFNGLDEDKCDIKQGYICELPVIIG